MTLTKELLAELKEMECYGYTCKHEYSERHFIINKSFLEQAISKAVKQEREKNARMIRDVSRYLEAGELGHHKDVLINMAEILEETP